MARNDNVGNSGARDPERIAGARRDAQHEPLRTRHPYARAKAKLWSKSKDCVCSPRRTLKLSDFGTRRRHDFCAALWFEALQEGFCKIHRHIKRQACHGSRP